MPKGVLFALLAYGLYSCGDAIIKGIGSALSVFEISFFIVLFSLVPAVFTTPKGESWRRMWTMKHPLLLQARGITGICGSLCVIFAFTHIPLAEAYSIVFLTPVFVVVISVILLKEHVGIPRWFFLTLSFIGVLLVVRPGFRELQLGHIAAMAAAVFGAGTNIILRMISADESRVSLLGVAAVYALVFNGIAMTVVGFTMPTLSQVLLLASIGALSGTANIFFIAATRLTPASMVAPTQYSQLIWAILLGALFYAEFPDAMAIVGLAVVALSGVLNVMSDQTRIRVISRFAIGRATPPDDKS